ncbi:MAG: leucine-rich repeat domain-containing protein [Clostridia bacterium]|nr:leucine-rich repeat domain-containing protein [Clostridia bacterium]
MPKTEVISKGKLARVQNGIPVEACSYVMAKDEDGRFILLKLRNRKNAQLSGVAVNVKQYDKAGNLLREEREKVPLKGVKGRFVLTKKIEAHPNCLNFTAEVCEAEYGSYHYSLAGGGVVLEYAAEAEVSSYNSAPDIAALGGEAVKYGVKKHSMPKSLYALAAVLAVLLAAIIALVTGFSFKTTEVAGTENSSETNTADTPPSYISYAGVEYTGVIYGDGEGESGLKASGYTGSSGNVVIPQEVDGYAVLTIEDDAFIDNTIIKSVTVEADVDISEYSFYGCTNLKKVTITGSSTAVERYAFYGCTSLVSIELSENITYIGSYAFFGCSSLTSVTLPESLLAIYEKAFYYCNALSVVYNYSSLPLSAGSTSYGSVAAYADKVYSYGS